MRKFSKIEHSKKKQSFEVTQELLRREVPFYQKLLNILGWLQLMANRALIVPANVCTWQTDVGGYGETNLSLATNCWHGVKFQVENLRGELGRSEKNILADIPVNLFVFNAGDKGCYRVSAFFEIGFGDSDAAEEFGLALFDIRLSRNWLPYKRKLGTCDLTNTAAPLFRTYGWAGGSDIVYLEPGDKLSIWMPLHGFSSIEPYPVNIEGYITINYLGEGNKNTKEITNEVTTWDLV